MKTNFSLDDLDTAYSDDITLVKDKKSIVKSANDKILLHDILTTVNNASKPTATKKEILQCKLLLSTCDNSVLKDIMPEISNLYIHSKKDMVLLFSTFGIQERTLSSFGFGKLDLKNNGKVYPVLYKDEKKRLIKLPNELDTLFYRQGGKRWTYGTIQAFTLMHIRGYNKEEVLLYENRYFSQDIAEKQAEWICKEYSQMSDYDKEFLSRIWDTYDDGKHTILEVGLICNKKILYISRLDKQELAFFMLNYDNFDFSDFGDDTSNAKKSKTGLNKFLSKEYDIKLPSTSIFAKYNGLDAILYTLPVDLHERKSTVIYNLRDHSSTFYDLLKYVDRYKMKSKKEYTNLTSILSTLFMYTTKLVKSELTDRFEPTNDKESLICVRLNIGNNYVMAITLSSETGSDYYSNIFKVYLIDNRDHNVITTELYLNK